MTAATVSRCRHELDRAQCGFCLGTWRLLPPLPEAGPGGVLGLHSALFRAARQPTDDGMSPVDLDLDLDEEDDDA